jgi:hypothetical protein
MHQAVFITAGSLKGLVIFKMAATSAKGTVVQIIYDAMCLCFGHFRLDSFSSVNLEVL